VCGFYFSKEENVYFNIRGEGSVIQASLMGDECDLLLNILYLRGVTKKTWVIYNQQKIDGRVKTLFIR